MDTVTLWQVLSGLFLILSLFFLFNPSEKGTITFYSFLILSNIYVIGGQIMTKLIEIQTPLPIEVVEVIEAVTTVVQ